MKQKSKILISVFIFSSFLFPLSFFYAYAAPEFLTTWQAQNYVPSWYQGKIFPTYGSKIEARFEFVDNGKIVDLSKTAVRWYINDELMVNESKGLGIKTFSFSNLNIYAGNDIEVRISIPDYKGQSFDKFFTIPVKSQEVVIEGDYFSKQIGKTKNAFYAWPFFFNSANNLSFKWLMDGNEVGSNSSSLFIDVDSQTRSGTKINLISRVENLNNQMELAELLSIYEIK